MRRLPFAAAAGLAVLAGACDPGTQPRVMNTPPIEPLRLETPEPGYRLSAADRARVHPDCDPDALERLMAMIQPSFRRMLLRNFLVPTPEEAGAGTAPGWGWIVELRDPNADAADPVLQRLLNDVYAPVWDRVSDEELEIPNFLSVPGQERARERRKARRAPSAEPPPREGRQP